MSVLRPPAASFWFPFAAVFGIGASRRARVRRVDPVVRAPASPIPRASSSVDRILAAARTAPQLEMIEWNGDLPAPRKDFATVTRSETPAQPWANAANDDPSALDAMRRKIRDRYIGARFPGVVRGGADLGDTERVIKSARLLFEEDRLGEALELLQLAIDEMPLEPSRWLALLEILYLARDAGEYVAVARDFRRRHAGAQDAWNEICRLGRALAPGEALFGAASGPRDHDHYGPWPHTPNWIQAPWDLTADVAAADFHRAMARNAQAA